MATKKKQRATPTETVNVLIQNLRFQLTNN